MPESRKTSHTVLTDGSRAEGGGAVAAVVWLQKDHQPRPWGPPTREQQVQYERFDHHIAPGVPEGWTGERFHLGNNKEGFDAELYAILRAMGVPLRRQE